MAIETLRITLTGTAYVAVSNGQANVTIKNLSTYGVRFAALDTQPVDAAVLYNTIDPGDYIALGSLGAAKLWARLDGSAGSGVIEVIRG